MRLGKTCFKGEGCICQTENNRKRSGGKERDDKDLLDIDATIYCERESHKGILIGKNGTMLRKIATLARKDLERFFYIQVNLQCWVKVKEDWRNKEGLIHNFGLDNPE